MDRKELERPPFGTYADRDILQKVKDKMKRVDKYMSFTDWFERAMLEYLDKPEDTNN